MGMSTVSCARQKYRLIKSVVTLLGSGLLAVGCSWNDNAESVRTLNLPIQGGEETTFSAWPAVLNIAERCTGIAIGRRHFLTAWHCVPFEHVKTATAILDVDGCTPPPLALGAAAQDIALCSLSTHSDDFEHFVSLWTDEADLAGTEVVLVGVGLTDFEAEDSGVLREVDATVTDDSDGELVIGNEMQGTCPGDSGGPALHISTEGEHRLVGVLTAGEAGKCGLGYYSRVSRLAPWISEEVALESQATSCQIGGIATRQQRPLGPVASVFWGLLLFVACWRRRVVRFTRHSLPLHRE